MYEELTYLLLSLRVNVRLSNLIVKELLSRKRIKTRCLSRHQPRITPNLSTNSLSGALHSRGGYNRPVVSGRPTQTPSTRRPQETRLHISYQTTGVSEKPDRGTYCLSVIYKVVLLGLILVNTSFYGYVRNAFL